MKFDENHIITFNGLFQEDNLDIIIENIEYITKMLSAKYFTSATIYSVPPVINNWIGNRPIGIESDEKLMKVYNNFFIAYKDWLLYFKNDHNTSYQNKQLISDILYGGPIYRLICSWYDSNSIDVIRNGLYVSWSSTPMDESNPRHSYWMSKMRGQIKYLESEIVNDFGINLSVIPGVYSNEFEVVYPTTKTLNIKEHIIE